MKRYAIITNARTRRGAEAYLPDNYKIVHETAAYPPGSFLQGQGKPRLAFVVEGEDVAGWTLDSYVIPRLMSGLMHCEEIDLSHAVMREVRASRSGASPICTCGIEETPERRAHYGHELHSPYCEVGRAERAAAGAGASKECAHEGRTTHGQCLECGKLPYEQARHEASGEFFCDVCGERMCPDPTGSEGVWVHDAEELGDEAYDLNEDHAPYSAEIEEVTSSRETRSAP